MTNRERLLRSLSAVQFALWELHLYLDTHPTDMNAAAMNEKYKVEAIRLKKEFEDTFGPLSPMTNSGVEWLKNPWPWEREGCDV